MEKWVDGFLNFRSVLYLKDFSGNLSIEFSIAQRYVLLEFYEWNWPFLSFLGVKYYVGWVI